MHHSVHNGCIGKSSIAYALIVWGRSQGQFWTISVISSSSWSSSSSLSVSLDDSRYRIWSTRSRGDTLDCIRSSIASTSEVESPLCREESLEGDQSNHVLKYQPELALLSLLDRPSKFVWEFADNNENIDRELPAKLNFETGACDYLNLAILIPSGVVMPWSSHWKFPSIIRILKFLTSPVNDVLSISRDGRFSIYGTIKKP